MKLPLYQVDAFADQVFKGNPAAVCPLEEWLPDDLMQQIAMENAVAETAFFVARDQGFEIRWFTPEIEIDLCGHATLATAHVLVRHLNYHQSSLSFHSQSGELSVAIGETLLTLNFPARKPLPASAPPAILDAIQFQPSEVLKARDYVLVFDDEQVIREIAPNPSVMNQINIDPGGVIVTARGQDVDFVSRFFTPQASVFEDPVTGSAHCSLVPYWSEKLGKAQFIAAQLSARGGRLFCTHAQDRVLIAGKAKTYLEGFITI